MRRCYLICTLLLLVLSTSGYAADYGLTFDGTDDYLIAPLSTTQTNNVTIEAWIKWDGTTGSQMIFYNGNSGANGFGLHLEVTTNYFYVNVGAKSTYNANFAPASDTWIHVAVVNNGGAYTLYVNGSGTALGSNTPNVPSGNFFLSSTGQPFHGSMKEVRVSTIARYTSDFTPDAVLTSDANTAALYHLSESSGQTAADATGGGKTGQLGSTAGVDDNDPTWIEASLPVCLSAFSARQNGGAVVLAWTTESETDNLGYIIERKTVDTDWAEIATYQNVDELKCAGNTSSKTEYVFTDDDVLPGETYSYRLSNVDTKGKVDVKDVISITLADIPQVTELLPATPNPFNPATKIQYKLADEADVTLNVVDMLGRTVQTIVHGDKQPAGSYSIHWNGKNEAGQDAASGVYLLVLKAGDVRKTQKVMLVR